MTATPTTRVVDVGVGSLFAPLSPLTGGRMDVVLAAVDERFGIRVDADGVQVRRPWWTTNVPWDDIGQIHLDSRLDRVLTLAMSFVPVARIPLVGGAIVSSADRVVTEATTRLAPGVREDVGWTVATLRRPGWRPDVDVEHGVALAALLRPSLTDALVGHANARSIDVVRDRDSA